MQECRSLPLPFQLSGIEVAIIEQRITEFLQLNKMGNEEWFSELCFCLLTANAQAQKAIDIQKHLGYKGFIEHTQEGLARVIRSYGHRFHNKKANYIVLARKYKNIKDTLHGLTSIQARDFLVNHIKGLGYKEASHFLRNVGYHDLAIIDRHIIKFLYKNKYINAVPKIINKKLYVEYERFLTHYQIALNKLDLMIWCHITGKVLK